VLNGAIVRVGVPEFVDRLNHPDNPEFVDELPAGKGEIDLDAAGRVTRIEEIACIVVTEEDLGSPLLVEVKFGYCGEEFMENAMISEEAVPTELEAFTVSPELLEVVDTSSPPLRDELLGTESE